MCIHHLCSYAHTSVSPCIWETQVNKCVGTHSLMHAQLLWNYMSHILSWSDLLYRFSGSDPGWITCEIDWLDDVEVYYCVIVYSCAAWLLS